MEDDGSKPKWRKDFPTAWNDDNYVTRRDFTKFLVLTSGALVVGNGYFVLRRPTDLAAEATPRTLVASTDELQVGGVKLFAFPTENDSALLVRTSDTEYAAYRQRCTHLGCPVTYSHDSNKLECPCHNGSFNVSNGQVLEGPPPSPLPKITLAIENGQIFAVGWEKQS